MTIGIPLPTWCNVHQRDFSLDTDLKGDLMGCCSLCLAAAILACEADGMFDEWHGLPLSEEERGY